MTHIRPWTPSDLARLRCLSQTHTISEAAAELGRTPYAVQRMLWRERIFWPGFSKVRHGHKVEAANGVSYEALSGKERAILLLAAHGLTNEQIAEKLRLPYVTVKSVHMPALQSKLHAVNRVGAVVMALLLNVISLEDISLEDVMQATYERQEEA